MIKNTMKLTFLITFLFTASVNATNRTHAGKIKYIYPMGHSNTVIIYLDTPSAYCVNAAGTPQSRFYLTVGKGPHPVVEEGLNRLYSAALTAFTTNRRLWVYFDDSSAACYMSRIFMYPE